jgi:hypothetical protein
MNYSRIITATVVAVGLCLTASTASAQRRGGGRSFGRPGIGVGRAVPRPFIRTGRPFVVAPRIISPRIIGYVPYRPYFYRYRPGLTVGFFTGFGYGYPYRYYPYAYPYGYYGYPYPYAAYGYPLPPAGYMSAVPGYAYGGVHIEGAPEDAQVFVDGYYVGVVDDFDGPFQHLNLQAGTHRIEIRPQGYPPVAFDVNVQPGQTMTVHAGLR